MVQSKTAKTGRHKRHVRRLTSRIRTTPHGDRVRKIRDIASAILEESSSLEYMLQLAEASDSITRLRTKHSIDLFAEVQRFEIGLIKRALELAGGNQARAAKLLRLRKTTLHSKVKTYGLR